MSQIHDTQTPLRSSSRSMNQSRNAKDVKCDKENQQPCSQITVSTDYLTELKDKASELNEYKKLFDELRSRWENLATDHRVQTDENERLNARVDSLMKEKRELRTRLIRAVNARPPPPPQPPTFAAPPPPPPPLPPPAPPLSVNPHQRSLPVAGPPSASGTKSQMLGVIAELKVKLVKKGNWQSGVYGDFEKKLAEQKRERKEKGYQV